MDTIYLDHCATTPLHPEVMAAMMKYFGNYFGNPGSAHAHGRIAKKAIDEARLQVAQLLGGEPDEIVFTSGGTEADNLAILGLAAAAPKGRNHVVTSSVEHPAVTNACRYLETIGFDVTYLPVDACGRIDPADVVAAVTEKTCLVSIIHGNNEVGVLEPLPAVCAIAHERGVPVHTDAVQTVGKIPFDIQDVPVDCLSLAAHKIYGPKGVGALYVRRGVNIQARSFGGGQENGLRPGTENVPGIVGLGKACEIILREMAVQLDHTRVLRDFLEMKLIDTVPDIMVHAAGADRLPHVLSVSFRGLSGDVLMQELDRKGIAASAGATCHAGQAKVSPVMKAMGVPDDYAPGAVRFSVGRVNQRQDIEEAAKIIGRLVADLRNKS